MGKLRKRMSFSRINEGLEMPDLIEVQKRSYQRFLETDLKEVLADASPITNYNGNLELTFTDYSLGEPKNSVEPLPRAGYDLRRAAEHSRPPVRQRDFRN